MFETPRNVLNFDEIGLVIVASKDARKSTKTETVKRLIPPILEITAGNKPAWTDDDIWDMMETPEWRQLLIIADDLGVYETGLSIMALEKGFSVFFSCENLSSTDSRAQRLKQAGAILISLDDLINEFGSGGGVML